jgi:hypothetical protein
MLQKAIIPFGVDGGTRSRAADKIITYKTENEFQVSSRYHKVELYEPLLMSPNRKNDRPSFWRSLRSRP